VVGRKDNVFTVGAPGESKDVGPQRRNVALYFRATRVVSSTQKR
jgi:hypothetical protein